MVATAAARYVQAPTAKGGGRGTSSDFRPKTTHSLRTVYDIDPQTGTSVEIFYADRALATSFGARAGWFWWAYQPGFLPGTSDWPICHQLCRVPQFRYALDNAQR